MIRERSNLVSDGTVEGTYHTIACPMCLDDVRTADAPKPPTVEVSPLPEGAGSPLLDWQHFLLGRKSRAR